MSSDTACSLIIASQVRIDAAPCLPDSTDADDFAQRLFDTEEVHAALISIEREAATDLEEFLASIGV